MNRQIFGPDYRTTAADRNARMANRQRFSSMEDPQASQAGLSRRSEVACRDLISLNIADRNHSTTRQAHHVSFHGEGTSNVVQSTRIDAETMASGDGPMDLEHDVIEQVASIAPDGAVHLSQGEGHSPWPSADSFLSQYAELAETTYRVDKRLPRARGPALQPHVASHHYRPIRCPQNVMVGPSRNEDPFQSCSYSSQHPFQSGSYSSQRNQPLLSKTDTMVIVELLNSITPVDGTDEVQLVGFLKDLMPVFDISPSCSAEIIKLLIPKVKGQMFQLCMEAVAAQANWDSLHEEILERFIPPLRRREIISIELERPQQLTESFAEYVEHLLSVAFALKTSLTEKEVIEIALSKCRPEIRSHFNFGRMPENIYELRNLASRVTSAVRAEERYFGNTLPRTPVIRNFQSRAPHAGFTRGNSGPQSHSTDLRSRPKERLVKCFRCNKEGHIARNCRTSLN